MLMIIAPSKTQELTDTVTHKSTIPACLEETELLIAELKKFSVDGLAELMKMSQRLAVQTHERINEFHTPFTAENCHQALTVFQGDVYSHIVADGYRKPEREYIQSHLRILSGLYGILRPFDLMQPYRLEMGCRLPNSRGGNLYDFWRGRVTSEINRTLAEQKDPTLVNLASTEYSRVINRKDLQGSFLQIDFKERKGDTFRTVAIHAKRARGMMVDFAVRENVKTALQLQNFRQAGYRYRKELSGDTHYVFTRD